MSYDVTGRMPYNVIGRMSYDAIGRMPYNVIGKMPYVIIGNMLSVCLQEAVQQSSQKRHFGEKLNLSPSKTGIAKETAPTIEAQWQRKD